MNIVQQYKETPCSKTVFVKLHNISVFSFSVLGIEI